MQKLWAIIQKDWVLLLRDKIGLIILLILPMILVLLVSLTQANLDGSRKATSILLVDWDKGTISTAITKAINKQNNFKTVKVKISKKYSLINAEHDVANGKYSALLIIPKGTSARVTSYSRRIVTRQKPSVLRKKILLYIDPSIPTNIAKSLEITFDYILQAVQLKATQKIVAQITRTPTSKVQKDWFTLEKHYASLNGNAEHPNTVQQNIPAWTLFGMFFIVIPLAGQMVRERSQGVIQRLHLAPVRQVNLLLGRTVAYMVINILQLLLMLLVGVFILPLFDLPALNLAANFFDVLLVGFFASLAAIGFGVLIGTWVTSYQQAIIFGPFIIVLVASISGIFVPIYIMPHNLLYVSEFSPMYWAQKAFLDIFVHHLGFTKIWPNLLKLFGFFVLMLMLSTPPISKLLSYKKIQ